MNKLLLFSLVWVLFAAEVMAQQKPQYSQYTINNYLLNPAITGIENYADLKFGTRYQWSGLEGAPQSYYATVHMPVGIDAGTAYNSRGGQVAKESTTKKTNIYRRARPHHGIGAMAMSTKTGPLKRGSFSLSYAYHQPITRDLRIAAGVAPGVIQYSLDPGYVRVVNSNDPAVSDGRINEVKFDLNLGLWIYSPNFYVGVAGAQLVPSKRKYLSTGSPEYNNGKLQQHYYTTAGYRIDITSYVSVIPSVMVKLAEPSPAAVDATVKVLYSNRVWAGVSYRHEESVSAMAGININHLLDVAYAYDASSSPLAPSNAGSHEVVLGFKLRNSRKILCPTWAW